MTLWDPNKFYTVAELSGICPDGPKVVSYLESLSLKIDRILGGAAVAAMKKLEMKRLELKREETSAYALSQYLGLPLSEVLRRHHCNRPLVFESLIGGMKDMCVKVNDVDLFFPQREEEKKEVGFTEKVILYQDTRNPLLLDEIVLERRPKTRKLAHMVAKKYPDFGADEYQVAGEEGLIEAVFNFDRNTGNRFITYACPIVKGRMIDMARDNSVMGRLGMMRMKRINQATSVFKGLSNGQSPTVEDLVDLTGLEIDVIKRTFAEAKFSRTVGEGVTEHNEENFRMLHYLAAKKTEPSRSESEVYLCFEREVSSWKDNRMKEIFRMRYLKGATMKEIADNIGVSESRVCQIFDSDEDYTLRLRRALKDFAQWEERR